MALVGFILYDMNSESEIIPVINNEPEIPTIVLSLIDGSEIVTTFRGPYTYESMKGDGYSDERIEKYQLRLLLKEYGYSEKEIQNYQLQLDFKADGFSGAKIAQIMRDFPLPEYFDDTSFIPDGATSLVPPVSKMYEWYQIDNLICGNQFTQERLTGKTTQYDHLTKLFDEIGEIDIYKTVFKNDLDCELDHKTEIFLSSIPINEYTYLNEFYDDYDGIYISIIPREDLSESEVMQTMTKTYPFHYLVDISDNIDGGMISLNDKDEYGDFMIKSSLRFYDGGNYIRILSTLNDEDLLKLGLALSTDNPMR